MFVRRGESLYLAVYDPQTLTLLRVEGKAPECCAVEPGNISCSSGEHLVTEGGTLPDKNGKSYYTVEILRGV